MTSPRVWDVGYSRAIGSLAAPTSPARALTVVLTGGPQAARSAREFTAATLRGWALPWLVDDSVLIASELVTNAVTHGCRCPDGLVAAPPVELAWQYHDNQVICLVTDAGTSPAVVTPAGPDAECGRGLQVVAALAAEWGWLMLPAGHKAAWAALPVPGAGPAED